MARGRVKNKTEWPCGSCNKNCDSQCVYCDVCELWFHRQCQSIDAVTLKKLGEISEGYICLTCRSDDDGDFDFLMGVARLKKAAERDIQTLNSVVRREILLLGNIRMSDIARKESLQQIDKVGTRLLNRYTCESSTKAAKSTADGDCLFNAISTHLRGDETLSVQLRYRTCLEMVANKDKYLSHKQRSSFYLLSPDYDNSCRSCAKFGDSFSSVWTIMALTQVISIPIETIYPAVNGSKDLAVIKFNTVFEPDNASDKHPLKILWSSTIYPVAGKMWTPNHFVPVVSSTTIQNCTDVVTSTPEPKFNNSLQETEISVDDVHSDVFVTPPKRRLSSIASPMSSEKSFCSENRYQVLFDDSDDDMPYPTASSPVKKRQRISDSSSGTKESPPGKKPTNPTERQLLKKAPVAGKFMPIETAFNIFSSVTHSEKSIPLGPKNDVYVVVDNNRNMDKARSEFPDDCGTWCSTKGTTANQTYALSKDNKLTTIHKRNGLYHFRKMLNGRTVFLPCDPQPDRVITFHRYYTKLKHDEEYKKRVTTIIEAPDDLCRVRDIALIEYSGIKSPENTPHGNSKTNTPYLRTDPDILRSCAAEAKSRPATEVCYSAAKDNSILGPKSARQINDKIYRERKNSNNSTPANNIADEVLTVISQIHTNCNLQKVEITKNKLPNIIIYTKEQLEDMKSNCTGDGGSVMGIDRTFNLGKCFVTAISYKNRKVVHRKTNESPIMLGPLFLHWDGETSTYHSFFSHIRAQLGGAEVTIGTDEERAMTNALHDCFNNANFLLCTKHVKENINRFLEKSGTPIKDRNQIIRLIFDNDGAIYSKDNIQYEARISDLDEHFQKYPHFKVYWDKFLENKIKRYVLQPLQTGIITSAWTNNNSESINNRLKLAADHKQHKLPELVNRMSLVSNIQMLDMRRALHDTGNFRLSGHFTTYTVDATTWNAKTGKGKEDCFWKLLTRPIPTKTDRFVKSKLSRFQCPLPKSNCGKKPGQRKRAKSEKTRTLKCVRN